MPPRLLTRALLAVSLVLAAGALSEVRAGPLVVSSTVIHNWHYTSKVGSGVVLMRIYASETFLTAAGATILGGSPAGGPRFQEIPRDVATDGPNNYKLTVPAVTLDSTTDSLDQPGVRYAAVFFDQPTKRYLTAFGEDFAVPKFFPTPNGGLTGTWAELRLYNSHHCTACPPAASYYSKSEMNHIISQLECDCDLAPGTANQVFSTNTAGTDTEWRTLAAGAGISVTFGSGLVTLANTITALPDLSDVTLSSLSDEDVLTYDTGTSQWINAPQNVGLTDVAVDTAAPIGWTVTSGVATLHMPDATGTAGGSIRGVVNAISQEFGGIKRFDTGVVVKATQVTSDADMVVAGGNRTTALTVRAAEIAPSGAYRLLSIETSDSLADPNKPHLVVTDDGHTGIAPWSSGGPQSNLIVGLGANGASGTGTHNSVGLGTGVTVGTFGVVAGTSSSGGELDLVAGYNSHVSNGGNPGLALGNGVNDTSDRNSILVANSITNDYDDTIVIGSAYSTDPDSITVPASRAGGIVFTGRTALGAGHPDLWLGHGWPITGDAATAVTIHGDDVIGTNQNGGALYLAPGRNTGGGNGGTFGVRTTYPSGAGGSAQGSLVDALTLSAASDTPTWTLFASGSTLSASQPVLDWRDSNGTERIRFAVPDAVTSYTWTYPAANGAAGDTLKLAAGVWTFGHYAVQGANVASAANITLGNEDVFLVTGVTQIDSITAAGSDAGRIVTLVFSGACQVTDTGNLKLNGNLNTAANTTLTLVGDGTNWLEKGRSIN